MKNHLLIITLLLVSFQLSAQKIEVDIFDNLQYESEYGDYEASLEKNVFDDLIFEDSNDNEIKLTEEYLLAFYGKNYKSESARISVFSKLVFEHQDLKGREATFDVDIFDRVVIEDNSNSRKPKPSHSSKYDIQTEGMNKLRYSSGWNSATLEKGSFDKWVYSDSYGNEITISEKSWRRLIQFHGSEEAIFTNLIYNLMGE